jgi:hypothetical protein
MNDIIKSLAIIIITTIITFTCGCRENNRNDIGSRDPVSSITGVKLSNNIDIQKVKI